MMLRCVLLVLAPALLAGCKDKCRDAPPAFELEVRVPAGVDGGKVTILSVSIDVVGLHRAQDIALSKGIGGGRTTVSVDVGPTGRGGFTAQVSVVARDATGAELARGASSYPGSGDSCNFFTLTLGGRPDAAVDASRDATIDRPSSVEGFGRRDAVRFEKSKIDQENASDMRAELRPLQLDSRLPEKGPDVFKPDGCVPSCAVVCGANNGCAGKCYSDDSEDVCNQDGTQVGFWRCVLSAGHKSLPYGTPISQVCQYTVTLGGWRWRTYLSNPSNCSACCGQLSGNPPPSCK